MKQFKIDILRYGPISYLKIFQNFIGVQKNEEFNLLASLLLLLKLTVAAKKEFLRPCRSFSHDRKMKNREEARL